MKLSATRLYNIHSFWMGLAFATMSTLNLVYQVELVGLNPLQLVLVGTALELSVFLFEIPTGVVADVYSRRLSTIVGTMLTGLAFIIEGSFPIFLAVTGAQALWGFGYTFISGAWPAWITDEVGPENVGPVLLRGSQYGMLGTLLGIPLSVGLGAIALNLPVVAGGAMILVLGLFMVLFMPEEGFRPTPARERETWRSMKQTLASGIALVRARRTLAMFLLIGLFIGLYSEGYDRLWTAHLLETFDLPDLGGLGVAGWFGVIRLGTLLLGLGATEVVRRRADLNDTRRAVRILQGLYTAMVAGLIAFALSGQLGLSLAALWLFNTMRTVAGPIQETWINQFIDSRVRATVLSMTGQVDALGQFAGGPVVGVIGTLRSIRAALVTTSLLLVPVVPLLGRTLVARSAARKTPGV